MQNLLQIIDNEPRVSHRVVAQSTGNQVKAITQIIHKYENEFTEFGRLPFKMEVEKKGNQGGLKPKTYYLNEPQATFLMTLLRNKPIVVEFKKKLVKAFCEMKEQNHADSDLNQIIPVLQSMMKMMSMILENQQTPQNNYLTPEQLGKIRGAVNLATVPVMEFFDEEQSHVQRTIYKKLNDKMGVASYIYIPSNAFDEVMTALSDMERKYILKLDERKKMQMEVNTDFELAQY